MKKRHIALMTLCTTSMLFTGCHKEEAKPMSQSIKVDTEVAKEGTLSLSGDYMGSVSASESITVTPMVSGTVEQVYVEVGDTVQKGDILCKFDSTGADFSVDSAKVAAKTARAGKKSAKAQQELAGAQTDSSISSLQSQLDGYKESLKTAKEQLKNLNGSQATLKQATTKTQEAYTQAQAQYKGAENLYINYQAFLRDNPDCQTSAGLNVAMLEMATSEDGTEINLTPKAETAKQLFQGLNECGLNVEYLTTAGLDSLKETVSDAEEAYKATSANYAEVQNGIGTLETSIATLEAQIEGTQKGIETAQETKALSDKVAKDSEASINAQIESADLGVEAARYQADMYTITAPMDGVVDAVNVKKDELFAAAPAFMISGKDSVNVTYYVTEEVKDFIQTGDEVRVESNHEIYEGHISSIATSADMQKKLFKVEAQVYLDAGQKISSGTSVKLTMKTSETSGNVLIPYDSVYYEDNQAYIFCVEDGKAVRTDVEIGLYNEDTIEITSGIEEGQEVITSWASGLKNGTKVEKVDHK